MPVCQSMSIRASYLDRVCIRKVCKCVTHLGEDVQRPYHQMVCPCHPKLDICFRMTIILLLYYNFGHIINPIKYILGSFSIPNLTSGH